jgi:uncharacterized protein (TIGR00106 family)
MDRPEGRARRQFASLLVDLAHDAHVVVVLNRGTNAQDLLELLVWRVSMLSRTACLRRSVPQVLRLGSAVDTTYAVGRVLYAEQAVGITSRGAGMSVLVAFSVTPLGVGEDVGRIVTEGIRVVRASGLPNRTDAMFTLVEGDSWDEVMGVVKQAVDAVAAHAPRVSTVVKIDYRPGASGALTAKVEAVERYLHESELPRMDS